MMEFAVSDVTHARPAPVRELVKAWNAFFKHKFERKEVVTPQQADCALRTFKYIHARVPAEVNTGISEDQYIHALDVLSYIPKGDNVAHHTELAWLLYRQLAQSCADQVAHLYVFRKLVQVLARAGNALEARNTLVELFPINSMQDQKLDHDQKRKARKFYRGVWLNITRGFSDEKNEAEMLKTYEMAKDSVLDYTKYSHRIIAEFYAGQDDVPLVKEWCSRSGAEISQPQMLEMLLKFSIRNNELDWCKSVFREVLENDPTKPVWDVILQWAAGALGKGVEDVEHMLNVMIRRYANDNAMRPDVETINGLVELAMSLGDSYLAERYIALGLKFGIKPNARTHILQMSYRADANDLTGAKAAYDKLQSEEVANDEDLPAINKYIRALCFSKNSTYDTINSVLIDLEEKGKYLEAPTTAALTTLYLQRDDMLDLEDLLQTQSYNYTASDRQLIAQSMLTFIYDRTNSNVRAWETYTLLRDVFDEIDVPTRTSLMTEFFSRGRCDMGCHTFGHMRQHPILTRRPKLDTYILCFEHISLFSAEIAYENLLMIHNMLKMDSAIGAPTTKLYNSLMLGYTACDAADKALDFWDDITNSIEGPNYRSLEIVFWACGNKAFGERKAKEIWGSMIRMGVEVTKEVADAYASALAGQGKVEEAMEVIRNMKAEHGVVVDVAT